VKKNKNYENIIGQQTKKIEDLDSKSTSLAAKLN
jgi:hypothetical protein